MGQKFNVGDKVRVVDTKHDCKKHLVGKDFTIKKSFKGVGNNYVYDVGEEYLLNEPELKLVSTDKHKFKLGDRVKIVKARGTLYDRFIGDTVTINEVRYLLFDGEPMYEVIGTDAKSVSWFDDELELVKPKFKVGDKVKIIAANHSQDEALIGDIYTVDIAYDDNSYILTDRCKYIWSEDELELVKPKFNFDDYSYKYVMHVTTEEQADIFVKYMVDVIGLHWHTNYFRVHKEDTCYNFNEDYYNSKTFYIEENYTILEFEDFDWSDFMKKEFTKKDLRNGDVIKRRDGSVQIVCIDVGTCICQTGNHYDKVAMINNDLTCYDNRDGDIIAVRRPLKPLHCCFDAFDLEFGELVYERKEVEEMTLEEVCKALGKEIKIVKK